MNKLIINHLEKLIVTADSATILKEMEVQHPAAKMLVLAAHMQEQEVRSAPARPERASSHGGFQRREGHRGGARARNGGRVEGRGLALARCEPGAASHGPLPRGPR